MEELEKQYLLTRTEVQEATLSTIGKELHDNIGQLLSSAKMLLGVAQRQPENSVQVIGNVQEVLNLVIEGIHDLAKSLDGDYLKRFNLLENLQTEVRRNNDVNTGLKLHLTAMEGIPMTPEDQIVLLRMIQEGIQNAGKHARAANIHIAIFRHEDALVATVTDDGKGFDPALVPHGIGLQNIQIRAQTLGGSASWRSLQPGTELTIKIKKLLPWPSI